MVRVFDIGQLFVFGGECDEPDSLIAPMIVAPNGKGGYGIAPYGVPVLNNKPEDKKKIRFNSNSIISKGRGTVELDQAWHKATSGLELMPSYSKVIK